MTEEMSREDFDDDFEPGDESDPEYMNEIHEQMLHCGTKPEDLPNPSDRAEYVAWLEKRAPEEE